MTFLFRFSLILLLKVPDRRQKMFRAAKIRATFHLFGSPSTRGSLVPLFLVVAGWYASTRIGRRVRVHAREIPDKRAGVPRLRRGFLSQKTRSSVRGRRRDPPPVFRFSSPLRGPVSRGHAGFSCLTTGARHDHRPLTVIFCRIAR